jgi:hypothetical protein
MPKATKANKATYEARVNKVFEYLTAGMTRYQMLQHIANDKNKDYPLFKDVARRQFDNYIAQANAMFSAEAEFHRAREFGKAKSRLESIFQSSLKVQDYQRAIAAQRELNLMFGLHAPKILELRGHEADLLNQILDKLKEQNVPASEVFSALLAEIESAANERK